MATDEWVRERANRLADIGERERHNLGFYARMVDASDAALQEAIERGKLDAEIAAIETMPAPRTRPFSEFKADVNRYIQGRDSILDRLRNPDEAMVEAFKEAAALVNVPVVGNVEAACRALAAHLDEPK